MWQRAKNVLPQFVFVGSAVVTADYIHSNTDISLRKRYYGYTNNKDYYWNFKSWIDIWNTTFWILIPFGRSNLTLAEAATITSKQNENEKNNINNNKDCPFYGCQLLPLDILLAKQKLTRGKPSSRRQKKYQDALLEYDNIAKQIFALRYLRSTSHQDRSNYRNSKNPNAKIDRVMKSIGTMYSEFPNKMATMSMIGYKGGPMREQINQDRSFVMGPFHVNNTNADDNNVSSNTFEDNNILLGVFDGHAKLGEQVAEYAVKVFPKLLSSKLGKVLKRKKFSNQKGQTKEEQIQIEKDIANIVRQVLIEAFVEIDATAPAEISGGCTASVVFKFRNKIYIANTGDSLSFIGIHRKRSNKTKIIYTSREHKPHLIDERKRIEEMGGEVLIPKSRGGTSRVVHTDPITKLRTGLAMSRSIGDWDFSEIGVIADPTVDVLDIDQVIKLQLAEPNNENEGDSESVDFFVFDEHGMVRQADESSSKSLWQKRFERIQKDENNNIDDDDIHIFAISATDGMMDYSTPDGMASIIALSLYGEENEEEKQSSKFSVWGSSSASSANKNQQSKDVDAPHLLTACEMLINNAADGWNRNKAGRYRDDIAISVSDIRSPSKKKQNEVKSEL